MSKLIGSSLDAENPSGFTNNWLESRKNSHLFSQNYKDFTLYDEGNVQNNIYRDIIKTEVERDPVSDFFFSGVNLSHLKGLICRTVSSQSGGLYNITPEAQSDNALLQVMRSIYLEHAVHLPERIREQVAELNYRVLVDMVPRTLSAIQLNLAYQRDQSQQPLPMDRPLCMSSSGTKSNVGFVNRNSI